MKNSVNKGFFFYILVFVVIVVAIVLSAGAIMMMSPSVKIFGFQYVKDNASMTISSYDGNDTSKNADASIIRVNSSGEEISKVENGASFLRFKNLNKLVIKTNGMNVNFIYGEEDRIDIIRSVSGFAKEEEVSKLVATKHYSSGVFTITALDSKVGLTISNNSKINVYLKDRDTTNLAVEVQSVSSGLSVATSAFNSSSKRDLSLQSVKFLTSTGDLTLAKTATITNEIVVDSKEKSTIKINKETTLSGKLELNLNDGAITLANIIAKEAIVSGSTISLTAKDITLNSGNGINLKVKRGDIVFGKIDGYILDSEELAENLSISVKEITGTFTMNKIDLSKANKSEIQIGNALGEVFVKTSSGNVTIKKASDNVTIETLSGEIRLQTNASVGLTQFNLKTKSAGIFVNADGIKDESKLASESGEIVLNYVNTLKDFEINATTKNKNLITFQPENETYESVKVVGYPSPLDDVPTSPYTRKVVITTNSKVAVSALNKLVWFK